jgi:ABC-type polar amino acid transport system ATPase subunit
LHSLQFYQLFPFDDKNATISIAKPENDTSGAIKSIADGNDDSPTKAAISRIIYDLQAQKDDWFSDLSGGQKSKVELVRKVFVRDHCPDVLLVDETMAPLDPDSKALVMKKLKDFCRDSVIIVIYHTDVGRGKDEGPDRVTCVPSNDFFDANIHLDKGFISIRETC